VNINKILENEITDIINLMPAWEKYGNVTPTEQIIERTRELCKLLIIPHPDEIEIYQMEHGTISIEISRSTWSMKAEIGQITANYYTIDAGDRLHAYEQKADTGMKEMAEDMNKNMR